MDGPASWLLWGVGVVLSLHAIRFLMIMHRVLRLRLQPATHQPASDHDVPPALLAGLLAGAQDVLAQGFEPWGVVRSRRIQRLSQPWRYELWFHHPQLQTLATVAFSDIPEPNNLYTIALLTVDPQGTDLLTVNGVAHAVPGVLAHTVLEDPYAATFAQQWAAHQGSLTRLGMHGVAMSLQQAVDHANLRAAQAFDAHVQRGAYLPTAAQDHQLSWRAAAAITVKLVRGQTRIQQMLTARARHARASKTAFPSAPLEEEIAAYFRHEEMLRATPRRNVFLWLFVATAALSTLALVSYASFVTACIIMAVVLIHELGHYLAMRAFGYRDTTIFLIPFVGGAAAGRKTDATLGQELVVLLAGPVPGLLLACAGHVAGVDQWANGSTLLTMLVAINLFNLLPLLPLDGGRIFHALLVARSPYADVVFRTAAALAFGLLAVQFGDGLLGVLAFMLVVGIPHGFRLAALRKRFGALQHANTSEPDRVRAFFSMFDGVTMPFARKLQLAQGVLNQGATNRAPGCLAALFWLGVYAGSLVLGMVSLGVVVAAAAPGTPTPAPSQIHRVALPCPTEEVPAPPPPSAWHSDGPVFMVAVLPSAAQAQGATKQLEQLVELDALSLGNVVMVGWNSPDAGDDIDEMEAEGTGDDGAAARMEQVVAAARTTLANMQAEAWRLEARLMDSNTNGLVLSCQMEGAAPGALLSRHLRAWLELRMAYGAHPPWQLESQGQDPDTILRAREAWVKLRAAAFRSEGVWRLLFANIWAKMVTDDDGEDLASAFRAGQRERTLQAAERLRAGGLLDEETLTLFLQTLEMDLVKRAAAHKALEAHLGASPNNARYGLVATASDNPAGRVELTLELLSVSAAADTLPALQSYMCQKGCTDMALEVRSALTEADTDE